MDKEVDVYIVPTFFSLLLLLIFSLVAAVTYLGPQNQYMSELVETEYSDSCLGQEYKITNSNIFNCQIAVYCSISLGYFVKMFSFNFRPLKGMIYLIHDSLFQSRNLQWWQGHGTPPARFQMVQYNWHPGWQLWKRTLDYFILFLWDTTIQNP